MTPDLRPQPAAQAGTGLEIAIIGMAGRFPGAPDVQAFWRNIRDGVESVTRFSADELRARGVPQHDLDDPAYVKAGVLLEGMDRFDAGFFGCTPREAEQMDPQQRLFLECAWEALEHAGHAAPQVPVGVYAGDGPNLYLLHHLLPAQGAEAGIAETLALMSGNAPGSLCTRVAYKLDLRGPAVAVQTACSTSLVAVHLACQALLGHDCDMALAGGVWLNLLQDRGYRHQAGAILSPDGHCRAFDARAGGTLIGSGAGLVVLRRLADALRDGDTVHAIIKGSAANNDGAAKIGYTAPGQDGQAQVIRAAQLMADVPADTIGYVETHGTGTTLGDPIEVAALAQAFRQGGARPGRCAIGSVKTNIGHLDAAAGVAGLIKTVLALQHRTLPPSLHFETPNPKIDFAASPFYVNTQARPWPAGATPRRAAVSAFGIGGTNAHVVLEEAPGPVPEACAAPSAAERLRAPTPPSAGERLNTPSPADAGVGVRSSTSPATADVDWHVLPLSARDDVALAQSCKRLAEHLQDPGSPALSDVAHTLQVGRKAFAQRCAVVADHPARAAEALRATSVRRVPQRPPEVVFLFPGGGTQHGGMGAALYRRSAFFRDQVDRCCELLQQATGLDLREDLFPQPGHEAQADQRLLDMGRAQPGLFVIEYALARWWMQAGVQPVLMLGHSLGEYVAACLAGVFRLEDALRVVAARGRLMQALPAGAMTAVPLPEAALAPFLESCDLAAVNGEQLCVLAGPPAAIERAEAALRAQGHVPRRLHMSAASHSSLVEPMVAELERVVAAVPRQAPRLPFISNVTGQPITAEQATRPAYWGRHLRATVRFAHGLGEVLRTPGRVLLEVGPGETLAGLARQHPQAATAAGIWASQAHPQQRARHGQQLATAVAGLWTAGVPIDWRACAPDGAPPRRVPLPTYAFQRQSYWVRAAGPGRAVAQAPAVAGPTGRRAPQDWYLVPDWRRMAGHGTARAPGTAPAGTLLLLADATGLGERLQQHLQNQGQTIVRVHAGRAFAQHGPRLYTVRPGEHADLVQLLRQVEAGTGTVSGLCHMWSLDAPDVPPVPGAASEDALQRGLHTLMAVAQALAEVPTVGTVPRRVAITVVANQVEDVTGHEVLCPEKAALHGPCKVMQQEHPELTCRLIDVVLPAAGSTAEDRLLQQLAAELDAADGEPVVAWRGPHRSVKTWQPQPRVAQPAAQRLRRQGVYLITGGMGGVGLVLARHLAQHWQARLVLLGRSALPPAEDWPAALAAACAAGPGGDPALAERLQALLELQSLGAEVLALQADVADATQLRAAVAAARQRFGALNGVIHSAGMAGGGVMANRPRAAVERVLAPKVQGTRQLLALLREGPQPAPDFVLLCSSLTAITGGFGQADYAAANSVLDALAAQAAREGGPWVMSVNWDVWRDLGMARGLQVRDGVGIDAAEGGAVLEALLAGPAAAQVLVSTVDLARQFEQMQSHGASSRLLPEPVARHDKQPRPVLGVPYVEPAGELEQALATLWSDFLGIAPIGQQDNLFELGGDSLLAIQLMTKVRSAYGVDLHPGAFFKTPTVAALAEMVEARLIDEVMG